MALGRIDGNSMTGICFVGYADHAPKIFVLGPVLLAMLIGGYFLCRGRYCFLSFVYSHRYVIFNFLHIFQCFLNESELVSINPLLYNVRNSCIYIQYILGLYTLIRLKISSQEIISERASSKIKQTIVRMGLFSIATLAAVVVTFYCHIYEIQNSQQWQQSFRSYMM